MEPKVDLNFDVKIFCQNLRATKPPYKCPVDSCGKVYKSFSGIQFHLYNYDHDNPENVPSPASVKKTKKKLAKWHHRQNRRSPTPPEFFRSPTRETLTYAEAQRLVEIDLEGRIHRIDIYEPLEIISQDEIDNQHNTEKEEKAEKSPLKGGKSSDNNKKKENGTVISNNTVKLPEAQVKVLDDYIKPSGPPQRTSSYYRYMEKSSDELDEEVEYDMDEEDHAWLEILNDKRDTDGIQTVSQEVFETLMDRFEKEAYFQSQSSGKDPNPSIDEDAVCSICMDGECQNSNVILFCDMCNLAVHQECYGVPYIPEGQWLCRRCLQSPSRAVDCCLCPNKGGAFKQTEDGRWAHVVCALWIPEVGFANTVFLEPIDSIDRIPAARKKLTCYICKQRGSGACIQCHKTNCYTAFHVTCAQQAGLFMKIEPVRECGPNGTTNGVRKTAYCDVHTPADSDCTPHLADEDKSVSAKKAKEKSRIKMRKARKILAEKRNAVPVVSIPIIPQSRLTRISSLVSLQKKDQFLKRLLSYWTLKRQSRFGVPLLRRLQSNHMTRNKEHQSKNDKQSNALREQLKYWQRLRQDLEKARLLVELIRKREKLKREQIRFHQLATEYQLQPFVLLLRQTLEQLEERDTTSIFAEPVSLKEVPDYLEYIDKPMDFQTMRKKVDGHFYTSVDEFESDFELIVHNCLTYNAKDTMFYKAAVKLRDQGGSIIRSTRRMAERIGFDMETGMHIEEVPSKHDREPVILEDIDRFMQMDIREGMPLEEQLRILLDKMDVANTMPRGGRRSKFAKRIKKEIFKVRRKLALQKGQSAMDTADETASSEAASAEEGESQPVSPMRYPSTSTPGRPSLKDKLADKPTPKPAGRGTPGRPPGRGRGRGRHRAQSTRSESDQIDTPKHQAGDKQHNAETGKLGSHHQSHADLKGTTTPSPSPSGVNRRTAVLLNSKKARNSSSNASTPSTPTQPRKGPGRPPKHRPPPESVSPRSPVLESSPSSRGPASPSTGARKRSASTGASHSDGRPSPPKRAASMTETLPSLSESSHIPTKASFQVYRVGNIRSSSESESTSDLSSGDEELSDSSTASSSNNSRSEDNSDATENSNGQRDGPDLELGNWNGMSGSSPASAYSTSNSPPQSSSAQHAGRHARPRRSPSFESDDVIALEPLDLVWAKCRGYPWYPALIINPKMPKTGYFHNGVPIPVPPEDVLNLQKCYDETVYLVLFFDTKRTWQWLTRGKLEPLGVDSNLDKAKLTENKKPNVRKAVQKAYEKAIVHRCSVSGEPNPLSGDSSSED
ncbi:bromodomain-containing protein 1-like isoform X5 [Haliotis rufescens]|uniref:bromodomain-containing protein 1-like isoform X5 n=1 Tax=Haliotis rufescens TaxID=6454 RepID=UPI001EB02B93|nr:bromodomain-containing protein 1-like isoform X5 [Haliotis rufescens]